MNVNALVIRRQADNRTTSRQQPDYKPTTPDNNGRTHHDSHEKISLHIFLNATERNNWFYSNIYIFSWKRSLVVYTVRNDRTLIHISLWVVIAESTLQIWQVSEIAININDGSPGFDSITACEIYLTGYCFSMHLRAMCVNSSIKNMATGRLEKIRRRRLIRIREANFQAWKLRLFLYVAITKLMILLQHSWL